MTITAKLIMKSYLPLSLEKGMMFLNQDGDSVYVLEHVPMNMEDYIGINGCPVEPYIYAQEDSNPDVPPVELVSPDEIGWWDDGPDAENLKEMSLYELNMILNNDGWVDVEMIENEDDFEVVLYDGMAVLSYVGTYDDEEEYEFEDGDVEYFFDDLEPYNQNDYETDDNQDKESAS